VAVLLLLASPLAALGQEAGASEPAAPDPRLVVGPPGDTPLAGAALDARTEDVAALLRCPVCQGLSVADSPASMAVKMKAQVKEMLAAGYGRDQILTYFERSYGEFVRLEPPLRGVNWLVWLAPVLGLLAGGAIVAWALRVPRSRSAEPAPESRSPAEAVPERGTLPPDPSLAPYVLKVREMVYGWPGGAPPRAGK
jgi:cytochrome c-type biogenesis protein CcmH